jgi:activator of HSP90 ATPase
METKTIKQSITFDTNPLEVYQLIMDQKKHAAFSGGKVVMSSKINGKFDVFDGYIHGYNKELKEGEKIVQAWHFAEDGWPDGHFSLCTFIFETVKGKTKLTFEQSGVPEHKVDELTSGWKQFYWNPMKAWLKKNK